MSSSELETCRDCGARGLAERIQQHDCPTDRQGATAHVDSRGGFRLVGEAAGEWVWWDCSAVFGERGPQTE